MERLKRLWTSDNTDTFFHMLSIYSVNSFKHRWNKVTIIIRRASVRLVTVNRDVKNEITNMLATGTKIEACRACSNRLVAPVVLEKLGIDVRYMVEPLIGYPKSGENLFPFKSCELVG